MIRVALVDDQSMVRAGFRMILDAEADITIVGEAADGAEAVDVVARTRPDVVLMDVRMPVMDGIESTRLITNGHGTSAPRVLVLTTFDVDDYVYAALHAGASGFLLKDARAEDLVEAIRVVARGDALLAPSVTRRLIEHLAAAVRTGHDPGAGDRRPDRPGARGAHADGAWAARTARSRSGCSSVRRRSRRTSDACS